MEKKKTSINMDMIDDECVERIKKFIHMSDREFYEAYVAELSQEEQCKFFKEFPEFQKPEDFYEE